MSKQQAERWVRLAWILGAVSGCLTFAASLAFGSRGILDPWNVEVGFLWMLAFGIYRRSRAAAVAMVAYYLAGRLVVFGSGSGPSFATSPAALMGSVLVLLVYLQGVRGVFALTSQLPSNEPTEPHDSRAEHGDSAIRNPPRAATEPDRQQSLVSLDPARPSADDILKLGRRRRVRSVAMILALGGLVTYGLGRSPALGMSVLAIGFLLIYQSVRGDVIVLWLRRFHEPRARPVNFGRWLVNACGLLAIPMTVQDSSFKFDRQAAALKSFFVPAVGMTLFGYGTLMLANDRSLIREWAMPFVALLALVAFALGALWYRRAGYFAVTTEEAEKYARRLVDKIEGRTGWFAPGVVTIRCADACWQQAVEVCMERAAVAVIDVTALTENIVWEVQTALRLLPAPCLILTYAVDPEDGEAITASVMRELQIRLGTELPTGVQTFPYPAIAGSGLSAWRSSQAIVKRFARLMSLGLNESPRAKALRVAALPR